MNPRVTGVEYKSPYKLIITFENNQVRLFDFSAYLNYPVYNALKDEGFCKKAKVFLGTIVWDDVVDFDPDTLFIESVLIEHEPVS